MNDSSGGSGAEDIGAWLGRQLRRKGMTQTELAQAVGVTRAAVSAWITGRAEPREDKKRAIAAVLGTDEATVHNRTTDAVTSLPVQWYHRPAHADGGREFGNAAAFAFDADLAVLAREATQNSLDERHDPTRPVRVRFTLEELSGELLVSFLDALKWKELEPHYDAAADQNQKVSRVLAEGLRQLRDSGSLLLLRVEDYNASGLTGSDYEDGRFAAVVRRQLDSHKSSNSAGGSYGLGKATLWATSRLGLVLINSSLSEPHQGRTERRLVGRLDLPWRTVDGSAYAGPAWLGEPDTEPEYEGVSRSWWADEETTKALRLERESSDPGTSFLIVGAHDASGEAETLQAMHDRLVTALADNFWAAMTPGRPSGPLLESSVRTLRNGSVVVPEQRVDPYEHQPARTRALAAYFTGTTVDELTGPEQVAAARVPLRVPPLTGESSRNGTTHEAVLLVTPTDADDPEPNQLVGMRGNLMAVLRRPVYQLPLGTNPFQAVLLAGHATGNESEDVERAEAFLRASEPPEHNDWNKTEELTATYARGARQRIEDFRREMNAAVRQLVGRRQENRTGGPAVLRELLRLDKPHGSGPSRAGAGHPSIRHVSGSVDHQGRWNVQVEVKLPPREDPWVLAPVAKFAVRSGGRPTVEWAELTAGENCRIDPGTGTVHFDPDVREASFSGVAKHPVPASRTRLIVELQHPGGRSA
ncbi:multiprotein-bridging factor 1 family protein [Streptomyces sp. NPDC059506]|uniref:helix-turn-helix domain-containing protein n=1 Tax=Streptomyces TaxID=1883 RepID=UPI0036C30457